MATVEATKEYGICENIGMNILEEFLEDGCDEGIDFDDEICFGNLDIKNSIIFLKELKKQLDNAMDNIIEKYEKTNEIYGENTKINFHGVMYS